ncbi:MAG: CCA tRNA nucleotidyltransferase [Candidatus Omnitrophica bacterium]|nr:CCA tRNA nucleotidyltransferase [Candidatus Omnitrophota bacterium]
MKSYLNKLPKEILDLIYLARDIAQESGTQVYLVGGFVRDLILGVKNFDLDIVVEGEGIIFAEKFAHALKAKLIRHRRFGTATLMHRPHLKIDFATARKEFYPAPGHLPVVESGTLKDDHFRRDFTINAMAIDITAENFGKLIDFYGGRLDLKNKIIRILHDLSFLDDPTRILRAIRFESRYCFHIEQNTLKKMKEAIRINMLDQVEPQRVRDDLILMFKEKHPLREVLRMQELIGFGFINPKLKVLNSAIKLLIAIDKEVAWFEKNCPLRRPLDRWLIYFLGTIDGCSLSVSQEICKRFVFKKGEEKRIIAYKSITKSFILKLSKKGLKPSLVFSMLEPLSYEVILALKAKYKNKELQRHIVDFFEIYNGMKICISGDDLHGLGLKPGPYYQKIFAEVLNAKLNGIVKNKEQELDLIKQKLKEKK